MPTPKASRQPPARIFENYVLTRVTAPGASITDIPDRLFETTLGAASVGFADDQDSGLVDIGFDFQFDTVTYRRIVVNTNGWLALADPVAVSSLAVTNQVLILTSGSYQNEGINLTNPSGSVLLCPWFDDLRSVAQTATQASINDTRSRSGYETPSIQFNNVSFGVKIFRDVRSSEGRRTIVRWNSLSDYSNASTVLRFEVVLYENGTIEFRYVPRQSLTLTETTSGGQFIEDATVGIFARGTNRFRDFSQGLGYLDGARQTYKYGGNVYAAGFQDSGYDTFASAFISRPYVWRLRPASHWPGLTNFGTILRFAPPKSRRRVLPRVLLRERDSRNESALRIFDDRRSTSYISGVIVNYPTTLQRFIGDSESGVTERQDLFGSSGDEMLVTGSIVQSAIEQFLEPRDSSVMKPFNENNRFDQGPSARDDLFYISGSGTDTGDRFDTPLWSKSQLNFSLPVNYTTTMLATTSSLFYYNKRAAAWLQPDNTTGASQGSDISLPTTFATNGRVLEDHRGFGPIGNSLSSGSNTPTGVQGTDPYINAAYTSNVAAEALEKRYTKSVRSNPEYNATGDETFTITTDQPFLIEKAVFKIPLACGPGWFNDRTTSFMPLVSSIGSFDFAGPGLTIALMNQVGVGNRIKRDLIMTATITHTNDNQSSLVVSKFPALTSDFQIRPSGFLSYASSPGGLIAPMDDNTFTGSVAVKAEALISNGVILRMSKDMVAEPSSEYPTNRAQVLNLLDQPELTLQSASALYSLGYNIAYIDSFGSGGDLAPSGRNVLGKGFATSQGIITGNKVKNPFYITGSMRTQISTSLLSGDRFRAVAAIPLAAHFKSPYLMLPGDTLVLAISKTRPFFYSSGLGGTETSGSIAHEVNLLTGNIHVTLFGSQLREGKEFHDTLPRNLKSANVRETIGMEPVIDQFEVFGRGEYLGTTLDDYITGTMVSKSVNTDGRLKVVTGSRGKLFSRQQAREAGFPSDNSRSTAITPWYESVGFSIGLFSDSNERFYDSLMPAIDKCFKADGNQIAINYGIPPFYFDGNTDKWGFMRFNTFGGGATFQPILNQNWPRAFPYEPRYHHVSRQKNVEKSFIATISLDSGHLTQIEPVQVQSLIFLLDVPRLDVPTLGTSIVMIDVDQSLPNDYHATGSMSLSDTIKVLYGFGDLNSMVKTGPNGIVGTNHFANFRQSREAAIGGGGAISPVIRGWKYGVISGLPYYSRAYFRSSRFGQLRDMLEQRQYSKFFTNRNATLTSVVNVRFVDAKGNTTRPENTQSQNLSFEVTSSVPFFDGENRNRTDINQNTQNANIVGFTSDQFNNISL